MPKGSYVPLFRRCADAETSASQPPVTASSPGFSTQTLKRSGTLKWILAAIIVVLAAGVFAVRFLRPVHHGAIRSVVVLPFVNRGAGSGDEYISDSLTDEVTNDLSRETPLQVVGRTSAFTYKGKAADVRQIGKTLSVDAVVEGSLRRDEGKLRMTVQIVGTADGYQRWSGSWERPASELFRLRDDVASAVVSALRPGSGSGHEHSVQTRDVWAFDSYLLGRFYSNKLDPKSLRTAIKYYEKAIAADPRFAAAWAGLATARSLQYVYADDDEEIDKARTAAYQALKIEPESSEAAAASRMD